MSSTRPCIGLLYPGDMGASLARRLVAAGHRVVTSLDGRSERTRRLSEAAGVEALPSDEALLQTADIVLSVLWPSKAVETAQRIAAIARQLEHVKTSRYVDLNAIAPASARAVAAAFEGTAISVVDGGIIGGPAALDGSYCPLVVLSGIDAADCMGVLSPAFGAARVKVVGDHVGAASALKLSYASLTKGFMALCTNALSLASATGTLDALADELAQSQPAFFAHIENRLSMNMAKAPRWSGEMDEISAAMRDVGLDGGARMFDGAARTWEYVGTTEIGREPIERTRELKRTWREAIEGVAPSSK